MSIFVRTGFSLSSFRYAYDRGSSASSARQYPPLRRAARLETYRQVSLGAGIFPASGKGGTNSGGDGVLPARARDGNVGIRHLADLVKGFVHRLCRESDHCGWFRGLIG